MNFTTLPYPMVDITKYTNAENGNNPSGGNGQLTIAQRTDLINVLKSSGVKYIANHLYMDTDAQFQTYYSNYATAFNLYGLDADTQHWAQVVHAADLNVCYRGSFSGIKGNNNFPFVTYGTGAFIPLGTVAGASTEGETTYCGKLWRFMNVNVGASNWKPGDIMAPVSEGTEFLSNSNYIWFDTSGGTQTGYNNWYLTAHQVVDAYSDYIGVPIGFMTFENYSELRSGYLGSTISNDQGVSAADYYGHYNGTKGSITQNSPASYVADWLAMRSQAGNNPVLQSELGGIFGDSWPGNSDSTTFSNWTYETAANYIKQLFDAYRDSLITPEYMNGINNWGGWSGQNSSIVYFDGTNFHLNWIGQIWAIYNKGNKMPRIPVLQSGDFHDDSWGGRSAYF